MKIKLKTLIRLRKTQRRVAKLIVQVNRQAHERSNWRRASSVMVTVVVLSIVSSMCVCAMPVSRLEKKVSVNECQQTTEVETTMEVVVEETTEITTQVETTTEVVVEETTETTTQVETTTEITAQTKNVIEETTKAQTKTGKYSEYEIQLLAKLVYGEARGESYEGQVAVAAVVLNRVESKEFPNTIKGVVYENGQFSCVGGSAFNKTQSKESSCYKAALAAIAGEDPTGGCLYFYNPKECSPSNWVVTNTTVKKVIGNHNFGVEK